MGITAEEIEQRHQQRVDLLAEDRFHADAMAHAAESQKPGRYRITPAYWAYMEESQHERSRRRQSSLPAWRLSG